MLDFGPKVYRNMNKIGHSYFNYSLNIIIILFTDMKPMFHLPNVE